MTSDERPTRKTPGRIWQRFWSNTVDEFYGMLILRMFFWHRRRSPAKIGEFYDSHAALLDGDLQNFFHPQPQPISLFENRTHRKENIWDLECASAIAAKVPGEMPIQIRHWANPSVGQAPRKRCVVGVDGVVQFNSMWFRDLAGQLNPAGIDVFMMDAPFNYRRTPDGYRPGQLILNGDLEHQLSVSRHAILDLWQLVVSLQAEGYEVGLVGVSFGGWMALMTSVLAEELAFVVAVGPPVDLAALLEEGGTIVRAVRKGLGPGVLPEDEICQAVRAVTPLHWEPKLDSSTISLHAAEFDRFVPTHRICELAKRWDTNLEVHPTGHMGLTQKPRYIAKVVDDVLRYWPDSTKQHMADLASRDTPVADLL